MAIQDPDWSEAVPMNEEVDEETLAAIDLSVKAADEGHLVPIEEVRRRLLLWNTRSSSLTRR
jgi:predicted transcriptional regulator